MKTEPRSVLMAESNIATVADVLTNPPGTCLCFAASVWKMHGKMSTQKSVKMDLVNIGGWGWGPNFSNVGFDFDVLEAQHF